MENLASGDYDDNNLQRVIVGEIKTPDNKVNAIKNETHTYDGDVTKQMINQNELNLKERITQCRNIIEELKQELNAEKSISENDFQSVHPISENIEAPHSSNSHTESFNDFKMFANDSSIYSECVDSEMGVDVDLMEYEKQLEKYHNTLYMAQNEKKNAMRKQMLAKAFQLKLLELENQCNVELLRVKQSLECLGPLKAIVNNWKSDYDDFDYNKLELIPTYFPKSNISDSEFMSKDKNTTSLEDDNVLSLNNDDDFKINFKIDLNFDE